MELTRNTIEELIKTKNLAWQLPVHLHKGVVVMKTIKQLEKLVKDRVDEYDFDNHEIFTYWDMKKDKPLFDIIVTYDENITGSHFTYELSDCSLFGMYLFQDNSLSVGMENVIEQLKLNVPKGLDYAKYAKENFKIALGDTDFV
jgi:hypothetical protein